MALLVDYELAVDALEATATKAPNGDLTVGASVRLDSSLESILVTVNVVDRFHAPPYGAATVDVTVFTWTRHARPRLILEHMHYNLGLTAGPVLQPQHLFQFLLARQETWVALVVDPFDCEKLIGPELPQVANLLVQLVYRYVRVNVDDHISVIKMHPHLDLLIVRAHHLGA